MNRKFCICLFASLLFMIGVLKANNPSIAKPSFQEGVFHTMTDTLSTDALAIYLSTLDVTAFYGHRVDSFLSANPNAKIATLITSCRNDQAGRSTACVLKVRYYAVMTVEIYVKDFTHMNPAFLARPWDFNLFKQERIAMIRIYRNSDCVNGNCD